MLLRHSPRNVVIGLLIASVLLLLAVVQDALAARPDEQVMVGNRVETRVPPPEIPREAPRPARRGMVWQPGYWRWNGVKHIWIAGRYEKARPGFRWEAPVWSRKGDAWVFTDGEWKVTQPVAAYIEDTGKEPEVVAPGVIVGEAAAMKSSKAAATWVWVDQTGTWHVRTSSPLGPRRFQGVVTGANGAAVIAATPVRAELADRLQPRPGGVRFDLTSAGGQDGFDFRLTGGACARFVILMNGGQTGSRIFLGSGATPAGASTFVACQ